jgi:4-carboxymuconolactone decarboxylase
MLTDIIVIMNSGEGLHSDVRREAGRALRARAQGRHTDALGQALGELDPDLLEWADDFIFGSVWQREGLAFEDRIMVAIVALAARGDVDQLRNYIHGALQAGVPAERIHESLLMLVVYAGFPTAIRSLVVLQKARESYERRDRGED